MVTDEEYKPMHDLSEKGIESYDDFVDSVADELIFKHSHPIIYRWNRLKETVKDIFIVLFYIIFG